MKLKVQNVFTNLRNAFILCLILFTLSNCSKDDNQEPDDSKVNRESQEVSDNLVFTLNTSRIIGDIPKSQNLNLVISEEDTLKRLVKGYKNAITINTDNEQLILGYYVKVTGSGDYFNIPKNSINGGRIDSSVIIPYIPILISSSVSVNNLCIEYCFYDTEGNTSNIVNRCIEIIDLGASGLDIITGKKWKFDKWIYFDDGYINNILRSTDTLRHSKNCEIYDSLGNLTYEGPFVDVWQYIYHDIIEFKNNSNMSKNIKMSDLKFKSNTCELDTILVESLLNGNWGYNETTNKIIYFYDPSFSGLSIINEYEIEKLDSDSLLLKKQYGPLSYDIIYYKSI